MEEFKCERVKMQDKKGNTFYVLHDKERNLLYTQCITFELAKFYGFKFVNESEEKQ